MPSPDEALHAFHAGKIDPAKLPPPTPPAELRAALDKAKAALRSAQSKADEAERPVARATQAIENHEAGIAAAQGLGKQIAAHYAAELRADRPATLSPELAQRVADRDAAERQVIALKAALGPLEAASAKAQAEVARAQAAADQAALAILAAEAEAMAVECVAARKKWAKLRNEIYALGAVRLNGVIAKLRYSCFLAVRDEPEPPRLIDALVQQFSRHARELLTDDADA